MVRTECLDIRTAARLKGRRAWKFGFVLNEKNSSDLSKIHKKLIDQDKKKKFINQLTWEKYTYLEPKEDLEKKRAKVSSS